MKWSDGQPFTADDFVWWYENWVLNDELSPSKPSWMKPGGELGKVEKIDDTTVKFTFMAANGLFLFSLANTQPFLPGHYLEQFHITFNKDAVEAGVADGGSRRLGGLLSARRTTIATTWIVPSFTAG